MNIGAWHQLGDRSQRFVRELLSEGNGVGVIISPRDLAAERASEYAAQYHELGAEVLIDPQFYYPGFSNPRIETYPVAEHRRSASNLAQITDHELAILASKLVQFNSSVEANAVIAPAVVYEAGRQDLVELNKRLHNAGLVAAQELGVPTYGSVMLGRSITRNRAQLLDSLSHATSVPADGWYFGCQLDSERIVTSTDDVIRLGEAVLALSCSGKPVLHAYAGPMGLLSLGMGATAAGIGHFQNLWQFGPRRWQQSRSGGGGGDAPPRFFSASLWGTIIYPDELAQLPTELSNRIVTPSPFSGPVGEPGDLPWSRWEANKHLVFTICKTLSDLAPAPSPRDRAQGAVDLLEEAINLHEDVRRAGIRLRDNTDAYQANWRQATIDLLSQNSGDFDYLDLLDKIQAV